MTEQKPLNRREFLERAAMMGAVALGGSALLAACDSQGGSGGQPAQQQQQQQAAGGDFSCNEPAQLSDLSEAQMQTRTVNEYVDSSPKPEQHCSNCALYTQPEGGSQCGGCTVVAGPIHPEGWCRVWVPAG